MRAQRLQKLMRLRQVLAVGALALVEIGHGVEPHAVDAQLEPEIDDRQDRFPDRRVVEIQVGLMRVEAVPVIGLGHRVPAPVRGLEILEDDPGVLVLLRACRSRRRNRAPGCPAAHAGALEPGMLVRRVVDHQLGDDPQAAVVGRFAERP